MKQFIRKTILFLVAPVVIGVPLFLLCVNYLSNSSATCTLDPSISRVFVGDSHMEYAIKDGIVPNSINVAQNSESLFFSYYKIKAILEGNPSVKEVYLGLSYHNLSAYYNDFIYGNFSAAITPKYFYLLPVSEQFKLFESNRKNVFTYLKSIIKQGAIKLVQDDYYPFLGGYANTFKNTKAVKSSMDKRLKFQYYTNDNVKPFSKLNINYLGKIDSLCKAKQVTLYTVNTPLFKYYDEQVPEVYKNKLSEIITTKQLNHIDLSVMNLPESYFIPDGDHVSTIGAEIATKELNAIREGVKD